GIRDYKVTGVQTCALPILLDGMVDGGVFGLSGGVDEKPLGKVAGVKAEPGTDKAAYREQAEKLVQDTLTKEAVQKQKTKVWPARSEEHTSELQSPCNLVCR